MGRSAAFVYGILAYIVFFLTFLYSVGFIGGFLVPKHINSGEESSLTISLAINLAVLSVFALQHSIMARPNFKEVWTRIVPKEIERSTYVWLSSFALILIFVFWRPMQGTIWDVSGTIFEAAIQIIFWSGWLIVLTSTFMIDHFDLFGLRQIYLKLKQKQYSHAPFKKILFYKFIRHPIMTGFLIAFWATPIMTVGHLLFSVVTTIYIFIAVKYFEEKDLVDSIGTDYVNYQKEVGMFIPGVGKK